MLLCLVLGCSLFDAVQAGAETHPIVQQYIHQVWQTEQGLPQNSAYALCQTRDGYLWIGTAEGLVRYDGVRFVVFNKSTTPAMKSNWIAALTEDSNGALWIGTRNGVNRLKDGVFSHYSTQNGLTNEVVRSMIVDNEGCLWVGTNGGGVNRLKDGTFTALTTKNGLSNDVVLTLLEDRDGAVWIGTQGGGLDCFQKGTIHNYSTKNGLSNDVVRSLLQDRDGSLWIGTRGGLDCLQRGVFKHYNINNGVSENVIMSLLQDRDGSIWIGSYGGGVDRMQNGILTRYNAQNTLSNSIVHSLLQDREGVLWIGTFGGGLHRLHSSIFTCYTTDEGLSNNFVNAVLYDTMGALWMGTNGGGLNRLYQNAITVYTKKNGMPNDVVGALLQDRSRGKTAGALWVGTTRGLHCFNNGVFTHYTQKNGLSNDYVWSLAQDATGTLWCGTQKGLNRFNNGAFTSYTTSNGLSNDIVIALLHDQSHTTNAGALWVGTQKGLNRLKNGVITHYTTNDGMASDFIWSLLQDPDGTLWIGTTSGLHRFKNGKFTVYGTKDGLFDDIAFCVIEDDSGYMWMSCNKGIYRVRKSDLNAFADGKLQRISCDAFGAFDGMKSAECNGGCPSGWKDRDGNLWFPTIAGVVMVNPKRLQSNPLPPMVMMESVKTDSTEIMATRMAGAASALPASIEKFEFRYTATSLIVPEKVKFRYLLEGYDNIWTEAGTRRVAYYNNLPHGRHYRFRVMACNNSGVWSDVGASYSFFLDAFWYETWQFYVFCAASVMMSVVGSYQWRVRLVDARNHELEQQVSERTQELTDANAEIQRQMDIQVEQSREIEVANSELQEKNEMLSVLNVEKDEFLGIAAHDLKNPLSAIHGVADMLLLYEDELKKEQKQQLLQSIVASSERMFELIKNLLDINAFERNGIILNKIVVNLSHTAEFIVDSYRARARQKQLTLHYTSESEVWLNADETALNQILDNLISNAIKYSPAGKNVWVEIKEQIVKEQRTSSQEQDSVLKSVPYCLILVKDEGPGLSAEDKVRVFGKFARLSAQPTGGEHSTGLGLSIVKKLVEAMNGCVWCESELGKGATFMVELPARNDSQQESFDIGTSA